MPFIAMIGIWLSAMGAGGLLVLDSETTHLVFWMGFAALGLGTLGLSWIILGNEGETLPDPRGR